MTPSSKLLAAATPAAMPLCFPSRLTLSLADGRTFVERVDLPVGAFCKEGVEDRVREKVRACCRSLDPERLECLIAAGEALGGDPTARSFTERARR